MSNTSTSGAPKKARWTTSQKAAVRRATTTAGNKPVKKPHHRGQPPAPATEKKRAYAARPDRGQFSREDRPRRFDGEDRGPRRFDRDDRPRRFDGEDRGPRRFDREDRPRRFDGGDRGPRREFSREDRPRRFDGEDRGPRREFSREDRPRRFDRDDRGFRPAPRDRDAFVDPEVERAEADTWTKSTRKEVSGPVEVSSDNGFAAMGLDGRLVGRLARDGITEPFPIQAATIPDALAGKDVLGRGRTGSGKTLSFGLPTLTRLAGRRAQPKRPLALVLVPTRELAMQVSDALEPLSHVVGLRHRVVAGGLSYTGQISALDRGVEVLVATPGRLNDLIERGAVILDAVEIAILDEADHMADMGFLPEVTAILDLIPAGGQRLMFSATLDNGIDTLVERYLIDPVTHSTDEAKAAVTTMEHHIFLVEPTDKKAITAEVANREGRTVIFVRTKLGADRVARELRERGVLGAALHGGLTQGARNRVLGAFREGTLPVLVATDVAARGIHVDDVSVVLQVDPPKDHKDYLHRSGRTARAGEKGTVVTFALPHQRRTMERLARDAGVDVTAVRVERGDAKVAATGAQSPSGVPVPDEHYLAIVEGPKKGRRGGGARGGRPGGSYRGRSEDRGFRPRRDGGPRREGGPRRDGGSRFDREGSASRGA